MQQTCISIPNFDEKKTYPAIIIEGWSHYDLYDKPEPIGLALAKLIPFYKDNL